MRAIAACDRSLSVIDYSQIGRNCAPLGYMPLHENRHLAMSQLQETRRPLRRADEASLVEKNHTREKYVILLAVACTLAWTCFWLWVMFRAVRALVLA